MNRRGFFKALGMLVAESGLAKQIEELAPRKKERPPGAAPEKTFLSLCTGCDACMIACPYNVILIEDLDRRDPFIYPDESPCVRCADTPCIAACPTGALHERNRNTPSN
ncbi:MAG: 4Fe-4S dicluster domain-containing protein [Chlamydiia bacterium]|nr:4Fe-4S dicluster domain-containing protein [Chlamydiia bacterium]